MGDDRVWTVIYYSGGDQVAEVQIPDATGVPKAVWTGPQVGWMMTRGLKDSYGRKVASAWVLIPMCLLFIGGLLDWRRLRSLRTLDVDDADLVRRLARCSSTAARSSSPRR